MICPTSGCSLVRLGIPRADAVTASYEGEKRYFCCQDCADLRDWIVCPTCLAEKPRSLSVPIEHQELMGRMRA